MKVCVIGLGYVGLPLSDCFSKKYKTFGFDIDKNKIKKYKEGIDVTNELGNKKIKKSKVIFTSEIKDIKEANFIVISVPTPIDKDNKPDLSALKKATIMVAQNIKKDDIIVYESTVYPGATEEECIPVLEKYSGLKCNKDFWVGYSPERINPGDKKNKVNNINKLVAGSNEVGLEKIYNVYNKCLKSKLIKVKSIKIAEASKILENVQRDINIAFINEMAQILKKMNIDIYDVLEAAKTKWNFIDFKPGLVGGHCIGVDSYYLLDKCANIGYNSNVINTCRNKNEEMVEYIEKELIKFINQYLNKNKKIDILVKGITFKENVNDFRNSKIINLINRISKNDKINIYVEDPNVNELELIKKCNLKLSKKIPKVDVVIIGVKNKEYYNISIKELESYYKKDGNRVLFDLYNIFDQNKIIKRGIKVWSI